ncbi:MAG: hypothetical protein IH985_06565 [Planctomycetes bacterium]|nr:hypothetical protein [Planctomycetota bacterium]
MKRTRQIYMPLLDEDVDVWRPVQAEHLRGNVYRILEQPPSLKDESWKYNLGDEVLCEMVESSNGRILAAVRKANLC